MAGQRGRGRTTLAAARAPVVALVALACAAGPAAAAPGPSVDPASVPVTVSSGYRATLTLRCPAAVRACAGTLTAVTARRIAPYGAAVPPRRVHVTTKPFSMAGGGTVEVRFRVRNDALAELVRAGRLRLGVRITSTDGTAPPVSALQPVLLRLQLL